MRRRQIFKFSTRNTFQAEARTYATNHEAGKMSGRSILKTLIMSAWLKGIEESKTCFEEQAGARS